MNSHTAYLVSLFSLGFIVIVLFWLYREYRVDKFRQKLFCLRDKLFDDAASGKLSFDDPAYGILRSTMNGTLRFGHRLNLLQMLLFILMSERYSDQLGEPYSERLDKALSKLTEEQRELVKMYHFKMNFIVIEQVIYSSPVLLLTIILPLAFALEAKKHVSRVVTALRSPLDKLDDVALLSGR
jgi:hypothetical protein